MNKDDFENNTKPELSKKINQLAEIITEITTSMSEEVDRLDLGRYHRECLYDFLFTACITVTGGIKYAYGAGIDRHQRENIIKAIRYKTGLFGDRVCEMETEGYAVHEATDDEDMTLQERFQAIREGMGITPQLSEIVNEIEELDLEKEIEKFFYSFLFDISTAVIKGAEMVYQVESDGEKSREILKPIFSRIKVFEYAVNDLRTSQYQDISL